MANEYLKRTPTSTGNRKVWTLSAWIKRSDVDNISYIFFADRGSNLEGSVMGFNNSERILHYQWNGSSYDYRKITNAQIRDPGSWIHYLFTFDSTKSDEDQRQNIFVNGVKYNSLISTDAVTINFEGFVNSITEHSIGRNSSNIEGAVVDFFFVDGQALTPEVFGFYKDGNGYISAGSTQATDFRNGQWVPRTPREIKNLINDNGGFGVNGFYLPMNDSSNFGADFHTTPNSIITLKGENLPQPRNGAPETTDAYVSQLREDPYAANLVLAVPGISTSTSANLVTNGTFDSNVSGWTAGHANASITWDAGRMKVANTGGGASWAYAYQAITTVVGQRYTISFLWDRSNSTDGRVNVRDDATNTVSGSIFYADLGTGSDDVITNHSFTATATTTYILLYTKTTTDGVYSHYDNIVVRQEDAPRDYSADIKGSGTNKTLTANGNAGVGYEIPSYYGSALSFDGNGDTLTTTDNISDYQFGTGDFTIETWFKKDANNTVTGTYDGLAQLYNAASPNGSGTDGWFLEVSATRGIQFYSNDGTSYNVGFNGASSINTGQWQHLAICRKDTTATVFLNGVAVGINTNFASSITSGDTLRIGTYGGSSNLYFNGQLQDLRVYKGVAKYKGGFDVPKPYTPVGIATWRAVSDTCKNNFATLNPIDAIQNVALTEGNLHWSAPTTGIDQGGSCRSTINITSGKWYWEVQNTLAARYHIGVLATNALLPPGDAGLTTTNWAFRSDGYAVHNNSERLYGLDCDNTTGITVMVAFDSDTGKIYFGRNGTWFGNGNPALGTSEPAFSNIPVTNGISPFLNRRSGANAAAINFGQNPTFGGRTSITESYTDSNGKGLFKYQPPSGFLALCEDNLPTPTIKDPGEYFKTVLYTGASTGGTGQQINGVGFQPDFIWIKNKSRGGTNGDGNGDHALFDSVRGFDKALRSNFTGAELTGTPENRITGVSDDGFSVGYYYMTGYSGDNYVAWCWKAGGPAVTNTDGSIISQVSANQTAGFSIVSYTGTGASNATVGHGLGKTPGFAILKCRDTNSVSNEWRTQHKGLTSGYYIVLNSTAAQTQISATSYGSLGTFTSSSTVTLQAGATDSTTTNESGKRYIMYLWAEVEGFSKFGSYVGNFNANGPFVYCGFKPAWIVIKRTDNTSNWNIRDSSRNSTNPTNLYLLANLADDEGTTSSEIDFLSNGFKIRTDSSAFNASGGTYIFAAFAESPFTTANAK